MGGVANTGGVAMKVLQRYLVAVALVVVGQASLAGPKAAPEQLTTQPVLPTRLQSFAPTIQPGAGQPATDGFGNTLNQREARQDKGRFTWGILGHGVGFNKRF